MDCISIKSEEEYLNTLIEIEKLMSAEHGTPEGTQLDKLCSLIEEYEKVHYKLETFESIESNLPVPSLNNLLK